MDDRPILVTGGAGFVGRYVLEELRSRRSPRRFVCVSRDGLDTQSEVDAVTVDLTDEAATNDAVARLQPAIVVHLAAQASVGEARGREDETWRVNLVGTLNLAAALRRHVPDSTVLFASTADVYGDSFRDGPVDETTIPKPTNSYARSKASAEAMFADVLPPSTRLIIVRPFNHTGPRQDERFVVPSFAAQIARMEAGLAPPEMYVGNLLVARTFLDVRDVARAYAQLIEGAQRLDRRCLFNVAGRRVETIGSILQRLKALARVDFDIVVDQGRFRENEIETAADCSDHLFKKIGWLPTIPLEQTLADVLNYQRNRIVG